MRSLIATMTLAVLIPAAPAFAQRDNGPLEVSTLTSPTAGPAEQRRAVPSLSVRKVVTGLDSPWDVQPIGEGRLLVSERDQADLVVWEDGRKREVAFPSDRVWVSGETGLMSLEVDPGFANNSRFYTCSGGFTSGGGHDVRIIAWRLNDAATKATMIKKLLGGLPTSSGRHGGCRLLIARSGALMVGTGDAAIGTNPRNLDSLGGKTLRLNRITGAPWPTNPFIGAENRKSRFVFTYGHRNVQGLAQRADGSIWSAEHGPDINDEVNKLRKGGDYGWHPVPGYNESVPMTDFSLPGRQYGARWSSGNPTLATSGASWVSGKQWGSLNGTLAVAALKTERVVFMRFDQAGRLQGTRTPEALRKYGRLRSITRAANGDLLITTDTDTTGSVLRVSPR